MKRLIDKFFAKKNPSPSTAEKEKEKNPHDVRIAACALLLEMANIDDEFSEEEQNKIISILKNHYKLSDEHAAELIEAAHEELKNSLDLWQFTNRINNNYSKEEKILIIEMIWKIIYADKKLDKHEDYLVHKLAKLLRLSHGEMIDKKIVVLRQVKK